MQDATRQMTSLAQCHSTVCRHAYLDAAERQAPDVNQWGVGLTVPRSHESQALPSIVSDLAVCATHLLTARANLITQPERSNSTLIL